MGRPRHRRHFPFLDNPSSQGRANDTSGLAAILSALQQRTVANEDGITSLAESLNRLSEKTEKGFTSLNHLISDRAKTPWTVIISAFTATLFVSAAVGNLALSPIRDAVLERRIETMDVRREIKEEIRDIQARVVPRGEHEEKWRGYTVAHKALEDRTESEVKSLQRQLDELKASFASTYGARDIILDLKSRLAELERSVRPH